MREVNQRVCLTRTQRVSEPDSTYQYNRRLILAVMCLLFSLIWAYWSVATNLYSTWRSSENDSAGQLVPFIVLCLLWRKRKSLTHCPLMPCWRGGMALLLLVEVASVYWFLAGAHPAIERYFMVFSVVATVLMAAGWQVLKRVAWILLFLFLMVPLPGRFYNMISGPLQTIATICSTFILEVFVNVSRQGNTILLNDNTTLGVAEACSGLRMLTAFIIVAAFIAFMIKRSRLQKVVVLLSSIPVAILCNIVRIVVTAILMLYGSTDLADKFFHDFAGLVMMPAAVMILFGELWLMDKLVVPDVGPEGWKGEARSEKCEGIVKRRVIR